VQEGEPWDFYEWITCNEKPRCAQCKKHGGFPTEVSDMARNMKMELLTFSLILYQSKNCGNEEMKKKRMIMKILKQDLFI
jgi:hypothetical protein